MAPRLEFTATPRENAEPGAQDELALLLDSLHRHGFLRFANDVVSANGALAKVVVDGLNTEGALRAMQNISILLMALTRIEPNQFYKVVFAAKDALASVRAHQEETRDEDGNAAPGLTGAYKLLNDQDLWRALMPMIDGLKLFAGRLGEEVEKPITAFTGKPTSV